MTQGVQYVTQNERNNNESSKFTEFRFGFTRELLSYPREQESKSK
jgi:hypothetical protein